VVAFIRGINVGGHSLIKMAELKKLFESLSLTNVKTVLASGNVIFNTSLAPKVLAQMIAEKIHEVLHREITAFVYPVAVLQQVVDSKPFASLPTTEGQRFFISFVNEGHQKVPLIAQQQGCVHVTAGNGIICSSKGTELDTLGLMSTLEKVYGKQLTTRTWDTLMKILQAAGK
jgi:uncharacterized protein (DUF1697 family)